MERRVSPSFNDLLEFLYNKVVVTRDPSSPLLTSAAFESRIGVPLNHLTTPAPTVVIP